MCVCVHVCVSIFQGSGHPAVCGVCERENVHCGMPWTAQSVCHNSICVSVVDDIAGDDATAGACDEATADMMLAATGDSCRANGGIVLAV